MSFCGRPVWIEWAWACAGPGGGLGGGPLSFLGFHPGCHVPAGGWAGCSGALDFGDFAPGCLVIGVSVCRRCLGAGFGIVLPVIGASGPVFHRLGSELGFSEAGPVFHRLGSELGFSAAGPVFHRLGSELVAGLRGIRPGLPQVGVGAGGWASGRLAWFSGHTAGFSTVWGCGQTNPLDSGAPADSAAIPAVPGGMGPSLWGKSFFLLYIWETKCMYSPQLKMVCVPPMIDHDL